MKTSIAASTPPGVRGEITGRVKDFALFKEIAARRLANPRGGRAHDRMAQRNGYYLSTGRSARLALPGRDRVEAFYGSRSLPGGGEEPTSEQGAILSFVQSAEGSVSIYLQPTEAAGMRFAEDALLLDRFTDTARLTGAGYIERRWRDFRAYAEVSSIDGEPSWRDRVRTAWLRLTRPALKDGRMNPSELRRAAPQIGVVALAFLVGALMF